MQSLGCLGMALLQDDGGLAHNVHLMTIFLGIVAAAVVIGFLGMCLAGLKVLQLMRKAEQLAERMEGKITPMAEKAHALVEELAPKVRTITTNAEQISYTVRRKVDEFSATADELNRTVKDANKRTQAQVARVDGIVNEAVMSAQNVSRTVQESVRKPVQQIAGIIAGLKRGIETWVDRSPFKKHMPADDYTPYEAPPRYTTTTTEYTTTTTESKRTTPYG